MFVNVDYFDQKAYSLEEFISNLNKIMDSLKDNKKTFDEEVLGELSKCETAKASLVPQFAGFVLGYAKSLLRRGCSLADVTLAVRNLGQYVDEDGDQIRDMGYVPQSSKLKETLQEAQAMPALLPEQSSTPTAPANPPWDEIQNRPVHWKTHKIPGDTPPAFIKRHYGEWLGNGLVRADVHRLDPTLYKALTKT